MRLTCRGRFQVVPGSPQLILDVAHNPHAARSLAQNLTNMPPLQKNIRGIFHAQG
ncbi:MAG: cyanophycin synthetase [Nitrosomonadales bacterium]